MENTDTSTPITDNQPKPRKKLNKWVKYLAIPLGILVVLGFAAGIALSAIMNPNQYKPQIEAMFKEKTGYKLEIAGDIGISVMPLPKAYIENIKVSNGSKQLLGVAQVNVYPQIFPLIRGEKKISSIIVTEPQITLEKTSTGNSWERKDWTPPPSDDSKINLSIDDIEIEKGRFEYADSTTGKKQILEDLNANASLASIDGPLNLGGKAEYNDLPVEFKTSVSNFKEPKLFAELKEDNTSLKFEGGKTGGKLILTSDDITKLLKAAGADVPLLAGKKLSFDGDVLYENKILQIQNSKFSFGQTSGNGNFAILSEEEGLNANIAVGLNRINVDELIAANNKVAATKNTTASSTQKAPSKIKAEIAVKANEVIFKNTKYPNLNLTVSMDGENIALRPLSINTPGNGNIETFGILSKSSRGWNYDGTINANAKDLRGLTNALQIKLDKVNSKGLKSFDAQGKINLVTGDINKINLSELQLKLDESNINGSLSIATQKPTKISFRGSIDKINISNYAVPAVKDAGTSGAIKGNKKLNFDWLKNLPVDADVAMTVGQVGYNGKNYSKIKAVGTAKPNKIDFSEFSGVFNNIAVGALLKLDSSGTRPNFTANANIDTIKLSDITKTKEGPAAKTSGGGKWSEEIFNFSPLDQIDGTLAARINSVIGDKLTFNNVSLDAKLNNSVANVEKFAANVFDGSINMNGQLNITSVPSIKIGLSAENIDVGKAAQGLITQWPISGRTSVNGNFATAGVNQKAMIDNLSGNASVNSTNISVRGLDLASYAYNIANLNDPLAVVGLLKSVSGGNKSSQMNSAGTITADNGVLSTLGLQLKSDAANGVVKGKLDLPKWYMDADAKFNLAVSDTTKSPAFGVHLFGAPDALKKEYDTSELEKYTSEKGILSEKNQQLLKPGGLENKINEKLMKKLGIQQPEATPATTPQTAPAESNNVAPNTETIAEPTSTQKKQDAKQQLLNEGLKQLFGN